MDKHNINITDYFDIHLKYKQNVPKISIKLKPKLKTKPVPSINGNSLEYYVYYLGEELGNVVYNLYRPLMAYHNRLRWYINTYDPDNAILKEFLYNYESKRKQSVRNKYADKHFKTWFIDVVNNPERKQKIAEAARNMWINAKQTDHDKVRRMIYSSRNKVYEIAGIKCNSIEYIIANILLNLNIKFEYERVFTLNKKTYMPDFFLPDYQVIIECYGDYWHANPELYKNNSTIYRTPVELIWERDNLKKQLFLEHGYKFIYFWEHELISDIDRIKHKILNII